MFESGHADSPGQALDEQARHGEGLSVSLHQAGPIPLAADFACGPGELLGLVGPSGSGKTTLLRAIAGLTEVASGYIRCGGQSWFDAARGHSLSVQARRIGFVFQDYALFPHLSARDNVLLAVEGDDVATRRTMAEAWLSRVRLEGLEDRLPDQLSGGQRQRVAVARALARKPQVLLLDEPFSAVDQVTRRRLQRELALLRETLTIPMLLVTHDLEEASALADRLCVLHGGKTLQSGTPETLFRTPDTPQIARLLDRHNVFSGEVVEAHGERRLAWGPYRLEVAQGLAAFAPGQSLHWYLPPSDVVLHRRGRPSNGERENPVEGRIQEMVVLGGVAQITLAFDHGAQTLRFEITTHAARRNALARGEVVQVSLLAAAIHLMPDKG